MATTVTTLHKLVHCLFFEALGCPSVRKEEKEKVKKQRFGGDCAESML